ncbi:hypothetical protein BJ508DRAFT_181424 [Ascobolus immersus RN42]|uniref:Uncharacterized protein n=1 Tax=Ascobolus immersus RN42 TaxID=1160509 RepID=A0A3N4I4A9_ASCIM|nr:hypothetical protein BJ508DRAFT_181424 [Ascobolus immersus RN42]
MEDTIPPRPYKHRSTQLKPIPLPVLHQKASPPKIDQSPAKPTHLRPNHPSNTQRNQKEHPSNSNPPPPHTSAAGSPELLC